MTQAKGFIDSLAKMDEAQIEKMVTSDSFWSSGISFVRGKSLVGGSVRGDIFEGITTDAIRFARPEVASAPAQPDNAQPDNVQSDNAQPIKPEPIIDRSSEDENLPPGTIQACC